MFVREKQIGPYRNVYLVESVRENGRTKQRLIKNLGRKEQVAARGNLDRLARSAARLIRALATRAGLAAPPLPELPRLSSARLMKAHDAVQKLSVVAASLEGGSIGHWPLDGTSTTALLEELAHPAEAKERAA
jgi:hypothetical protein